MNRLPVKSSYSKLPFSWTKDETCLLLRILRYHPVLYDPTHPEFRSPLLQTKAYKQISDEIKAHKPDVTSDIVRNKFKALKKQYLEEKKAMEDYQKMRKKTDGPYRPKLWCYSLMTFIEEKRNYNKRVSNVMPTSSPIPPREPVECIVIEDSPQSDGESENTDQQKTRTPDPETPREMLNAKCLQLVKDIADTFEAIKEERAKETESSSDHSPKTFLGLMIQSELSNVSLEIFEEAKWKIMHILEEATRKHRACKNVPAKFKTPITMTPVAAKHTRLPTNKQLYLGKGVKVVVIKNQAIKNSVITKFDSIATDSFNRS